MRHSLSHTSFALDDIWTSWKHEYSEVFPLPVAETQLTSLRKRVSFAGCPPEMEKRSTKVRRKQGWTGSKGWTGESGNKENIGSLVADSEWHY